MNTPYDQRFAFTTKGDIIRAAMATYYGGKLHTIVDKVTVISTRQIDDEHWRVQSVIYVKDEKASVDHYIFVRGRSLKIDWEASVGHWSMPPRAYLALGSSQPIVARVCASLGTSHYGVFSNKGGQFQAVDLYTRDHDHLYGYVRRDSPDGKQLFELLSDGNEHEVTLAIGNVGDETDKPLIHEFLSDSWLYDENRPA